MGVSLDLAFGLIVLIAFGCASCSESVECNPMERASFSLSVRDAAKLFPICDADVVADDGTTQYTLMSSGDSNCVYVGPYEKRARFTVSVTKQGYQPATTVFTTGGDECGVKTRQVSVDLVPE